MAFLGLGIVQAVAADAVPARVTGMRRLSETEYRNSVADIFGKEIEVQGRFEPDRRVGGLLAASSAILSITASGFESYSRMANSIATQVVSEKQRARTLSCIPANPKAADDACAGKVLAQYGLQLFRRPMRLQGFRRNLTLSVKPVRQRAQWLSIEKCSQQTNVCLPSNRPSLQSLRNGR